MGVYKIFSTKGEVWAVYKKWNAQRKPNNLQDFEYEIVGTVDVSDNNVDANFLEWAKGFKSFHKARVEEKEDPNRVVKTSVSQHFRF